MTKHKRHPPPYWAQREGLPSVIQAISACVCLQRPRLSDVREAGTCRPRPLGTVSQWGVRRRARGSGSAAVQWASGPAPRPPNGRRPSATVGSGRAARPLLARGGRGGCGGGVPAGLRGERGRRRRRGGAGRVAKAAEAEARGGRRRRRPGWLQPLRPAESRAAAPRGAAVAWGSACLRLPGAFRPQRRPRRRWRSVRPAARFVCELFPWTLALGYPV